MAECEHCADLQAKLKAAIAMRDYWEDIAQKRVQIMVDRQLKIAELTDQLEGR